MDIFKLSANYLLNRMRKLLPVSVKQFIKPFLGMPLQRMHADWRILEVIGPIEAEHIVLDIGARNGWFFQCWKSWCPLVTVHAFEPDISAFNRLLSKYGNDDSINLSQLGIGHKESEETFYHMLGSEVSSSFLQHDPKVWKEIQYETGKINTKKLQITTIDTYARLANIENIFLIKIDIQGYELNALKGAKLTLQNVSYILVESAIEPLYKDSANFCQVHEFLANNGFHLMNFRAWHRGNNKLIETDMLFRNNKILPPVEENKFDRQYVGEK